MLCWTRGTNIKYSKQHYHKYSEEQRIILQKDLDFYCKQKRVVSTTRDNNVVVIHKDREENRKTG